MPRATPRSYFSHILQKQRQRQRKRHHRANSTHAKAHPKIIYFTYTSNKRQRQRQRKRHHRANSTYAKAHPLILYLTHMSDLLFSVAFDICDIFLYSCVIKLFFIKLYSWRFYPCVSWMISPAHVNELFFTILYYCPGLCTPCAPQPRALGLLYFYKVSKLNHEAQDQNEEMVCFEFARGVLHFF